MSCGRRRMARGQLHRFVVGLTGRRRQRHAENRRESHATKVSPERPKGEHGRSHLTRTEESRILPGGHVVRGRPGLAARRRSTRSESPQDEEQPGPEQDAEEPLREFAIPDLVGRRER